MESNLSATNQNIATDFFEGIIDVLSKNTSKDYSLLILEKIKKEILQNYPFFGYINFKAGSVSVDNKINSIQSSKLGKLFTKLIELLGTSLLKVMIMEKLDNKTVKNLEKIGVRFLNANTYSGGHK